MSDDESLVIKEPCDDARLCVGDLLSQLKDQTERRKRSIVKFLGLAVLVALLIASLLVPAF